MVEQFNYDEKTQRIRAMRTVVRDDEVRRSSYFIRIFDQDELTRWLHGAGFGDVALFGEDGTSFRSTGRRMVALAQRRKDA